MTVDQPSPAGTVGPFVVFGSVVVAATTPLNLLLLMTCCAFLGVPNPDEGAFVFTGVVNVGLFLALCGLVLLPFRRSRVFWRRVAVVVALLLYLALCLAGTVLVVVLVALTSYAG